MGIMDFIKEDIKTITGSGDGFGVALTFTNANGSQTATINGLASRHQLSVDGDGNTVNSRNVHCSFAEGLLTAEDYTVRVNGEVNMKNHRVTWTDATGVAKTYIIEQTLPDDTLGLIPCILNTFKTNG